LYEEWAREYPEVFSGKRKYYDFNARVCAIRETFEEINILIVKKKEGSSKEIPCSKDMR
jgi:hypothetical protein